MKVVRVTVVDDVVVVVSCVAAREGRAFVVPVVVIAFSELAATLIEVDVKCGRVELKIGEWSDWVTDRFIGLCLKYCPQSVAKAFLTSS